PTYTIYILRMFYIFLLFSSILHSPTISTLFPYTTLFRSNAFKVIKSLNPKPIGGINEEAVNFVTPDIIVKYDEEIKSYLTIISGDRKSTRLNSSHVSISYAVFCLKKKKKKNK